jgi:hypothetical protein
MSRWRRRARPGGAGAREGLEILPGFPLQRDPWGGARGAVLLALMALAPSACESPQSSSANPSTSTGTSTATTSATGGATGSGGTTGMGGTGGATGTGGTTASGGTTGTGGTSAAGGTGGAAGAGGNTATGGTTAAGGTSATGGATSTGGARQDAGADARADGGTATGTTTATATRADAGADTRADSGTTATATTTSTGTSTGTATSTTTATSTDVTPTCTLPAASEFKPNLAVGGGGSSYEESDHFIVFDAGTSADAALNILEAAHQCYVEEWCWRSPGLSITENSGTYYKFNAYAKSLSGAAGVMQYDYSRGLSYIEVVPSSIANASVTVHEYGHALTLTEKGWVDQGRTGLWWESVAQFVADTFLTSPYCENARTDHGIATGRTLIDLNACIGNSFQVIVMNGNQYEAWPFLTYLTYNPDGYPGLGRMVLPELFRNHKGNNETPLHVLERLATPVRVQTIVGRYWARMAFVDIGHPTAQQTFLSGRSRLNYANLTSAGSGTWTPIEARRPKYCGSSLIPLTVSGSTVSVQITNLGNGQSDSNFTATLAIRPTAGGAVRYVDLPDGAGEATVASSEEATLVIANTPDTLYLYDPSSIGASDPANAGLNYRLQLTGAAPAN